MVVAVGWTLLHRPHLSSLTEHRAELGIFAAALVAANAVYFAGVALCATALARHALGAQPLSLWQRIRRYGGLRRWTDDLLSRVVADRWFRAGFAVNWVGALLAALVPPVAVVALLPAQAWSLLAVSALDVAGTMVLRLPIRARIKRLEGAPG